MCNGCRHNGAGDRHLHGCGIITDHQAWAVHGAEEEAEAAEEAVRKVNEAEAVAEELEDGADKWEANKEDGAVNKADGAAGSREAKEAGEDKQEAEAAVDNTLEEVPAVIIGVVPAAVDVNLHKNFFFIPISKLSTH